MKSVLLVLGFLLTSVSLFSQTAAKGVSSSNIESIASLSVLGDVEASIYSDDENQTYFIDFEKISVNLSDIVVKNKAGEIIFKEDLYDLPVNSIYELDASEFGTGEYVMELRSFTGVIRKDISID